jgi:hypothetical protein
MGAPGIVTVRFDSSATRKALLKMRHIDDLRPYWPLAHEAFLAANREWFDSSGGGSWAARSEAYTKWLGSHGGGRGILRLTDSLYNSLTTKASGHVWEATANRVTAGTSNPVANIHFSKKRDARRPMDASSAVMQRHMAEAIRAIGSAIGDDWRRP